MEFLFGNPIILIAILWAIASFFNKAKDSNQKQNARPDRSSSGKQIKPNPQESRSPRSRLEQMAKEMADRLDKEYLEKRKLAEKAHKIPKNDSPPVEKQQPVYFEPERRAVKPAEVTPEAIKPSYSIEKQRVIDGVVWSEILGPPRALKPHRTLRRK